MSIEQEEAKSQQAVQQQPPQAAAQNNNQCSNAAGDNEPPSDVNEVDQPNASMMVQPKFNISETVEVVHMGPNTAKAHAMAKQQAAAAAAMAKTHQANRFTSSGAPQQAFAP